MGQIEIIGSVLQDKSMGMCLQKIGISILQCRAQRSSKLVSHLVRQFYYRSGMARACVPLCVVCVLLKIMPCQRLLKYSTTGNPTFPHNISQRENILGWQRMKQLIQDVLQPSIRKHTNKFHKIVPINRGALQDNYPATINYTYKIIKYSLRM
jgi:hypothetical protein